MRLAVPIALALGMTAIPLRLCGRPEARRGPGRVLREAGPAAAGREVPGVPRARQAEGRPAARLAGRAARRRRLRPGRRPRRAGQEPARHRRSATPDDLRMPPKAKLADEQIAALTAWVKMGAPWPEAAAAAARDDRGRRFKITDEGPRVLVVPAGPATRRPDGPRPRLGRSRRSTASSSRSWKRRGCSPVAAGRQADADPPGHVRPDRPAADARGGRRLPRRRLAGRLREGRRPAARVAALRRALGPALARRRPLRRGPGPHLPGPQVPRRLPLPRLGGEGVQRRPAVRPLRHGADRRRPARRPGPRRPAGRRPGFFALGPVYYGRATADELDDRVDTLTPRLPRADGRLRPLPRPQVRPDPDAGLLRPRRRLRQHRLQGVRADAGRRDRREGGVRPDRQDGPRQEEGRRASRCCTR